MINTNVQEVCCNMCSAKKVVEFDDNTNRCHKIPEGWIMIMLESFSIGSREKGDNLETEKLNEALHFCSSSCVTNYFAKMFEIVRNRVQIINGNNSVISITDQSFTEAMKEKNNKTITQ